MEGVPMFDVDQLDRNTPKPRFVPPAPLPVDEIKSTLVLLEKKGHSLDIPEHKLPLGEI
jgi:hypothetical protein